MTQQSKNVTWDVVKVAGYLAFVGFTSYMLLKADERYVQKEQYYRDRSYDQQMLQEIRNDVKELLKKN